MASNVAVAVVAVADWKATVPIARRTIWNAEPVPLGITDERDVSDDEDGSSRLLHATTLTLPA